MYPELVQEKQSNDISVYVKESNFSWGGKKEDKDESKESKKEEKKEEKSKNGSYTAINDDIESTSASSESEKLVLV